MPLTADVEAKAQQQVSKGLRKVLEHLSTYVDEVFTASQATTGPASSPVQAQALQQQLDAVIVQEQELHEQLASDGQKIRKTTRLLNQLRSMYYQDLEALRSRLRSLLSRYLEYFTPEDLQMAQDMLNVRFFSPDSALDEDTEQAVKRKAESMQQTFNMEKDGLLQQLAALSREEAAIRQRLAQEQNKVRLLRGRLTDSQQEDFAEEEATDTPAMAADDGRSHMAFIKISALEDALEKQVLWLERRTDLQQLQALVRQCLEKAGAAKSSLQGQAATELQEASLERQRADAAENSARLEAAQRQEAENEHHVLTEELVQLRSELQTLRAESEPKGSKDDGTDATVHRQLSSELDQAKKLLRQQSESLQQKSQALRRMVKKVEMLQALGKGGGSKGQADPTGSPRGKEDKEGKESKGGVEDGEEADEDGIDGVEDGDILEDGADGADGVGDDVEDWLNDGVDGAEAEDVEDGVLASDGSGKREEEGEHDEDNLESQQRQDPAGDAGKESRGEDVMDENDEVQANASDVSQNGGERSQTPKAEAVEPGSACQDGFDGPGPREGEAGQGDARQDTRQGSQGDASQGEAHQNDTHQGQEQAHQNDARQDDARRDDAVRDDAGRDDAHQDDARRDDAGRDDAQQDDAHPDQDDARPDDARHDHARAKDTHQDGGDAHPHDAPDGEASDVASRHFASKEDSQESKEPKTFESTGVQTDLSLSAEVAMPGTESRDVRPDCADPLETALDPESLEGPLEGGPAELDEASQEGEKMHSTGAPRSLDSRPERSQVDTICPSCGVTFQLGAAEGNTANTANMDTSQGLALEGGTDVVPQAGEVGTNAEANHFAIAACAEERGANSVPPTDDAHREADANIAEQPADMDAEEPSDGTQVDGQGGRNTEAEAQVADDLEAKVPSQAVAEVHQEDGILGSEEDHAHPYNDQGAAEGTQEEVQALGAEGTAPTAERQVSEEREVDGLAVEGRVPHSTLPGQAASRSQHAALATEKPDGSGSFSAGEAASNVQALGEEGTAPTAHRQVSEEREVDGLAAEEKVPHSRVGEQASEEASRSQHAALAAERPDGSGPSSGGAAANKVQALGEEGTAPTALRQVSEEREGNGLAAEGRASHSTATEQGSEASQSQHAALASERPDGSGSSSAGAAASKVQAPGEEEREVDGLAAEEKVPHSRVGEQASEASRSQHAALAAERPDGSGPSSGGAAANKVQALGEEGTAPTALRQVSEEREGNGLAAEGRASHSTATEQGSEASQSQHAALAAERPDGSGSSSRGAAANKVQALGEEGTAPTAQRQVSEEREVNGLAAEGRVLHSTEQASEALAARRPDGSGSSSAREAASKDSTSTAQRQASEEHEVDSLAAQERVPHSAKQAAAAEPVDVSPSSSARLKNGEVSPKVNVASQTEKKDENERHEEATQTLNLGMEAGTQTQEIQQPEATLGTLGTIFQPPGSPGSEALQAEDARALQAQEMEGFKETMDLVHERIRRFSQSSQSSQQQSSSTAPASEAEAQGVTQPLESTVAQQSGVVGTANGTANVAGVHETGVASGDVGRPRSMSVFMKVPSSLQQRVPSKKQRRRRRRIRASMRFLNKAPEDANPVGGHTAITADLAELGSLASSDSEESLEVADCSQQSTLSSTSWQELPSQILTWLKENLMQSGESEAHGGMSWEPTPLVAWPELSEDQRLRLVSDFEHFLEAGLCRPKPSKYELSQKLRERLHHSEPPDGRRRRDAGAPLYEFPLNVEPVQISAQLRRAMASEWLQRKERGLPSPRRREERSPRENLEPGFSPARRRSSDRGRSGRSGNRSQSVLRVGQEHTASRSPEHPERVPMAEFVPDFEGMGSRSPHRSREPRPSRPLAAQGPRGSLGSLAPVGKPLDLQRASVARRERRRPTAERLTELAYALAAVVANTRRRQQSWAWMQLTGREADVDRHASSSPSPEGRNGRRRGRPAPERGPGPPNFQERHFERLERLERLEHLRWEERQGKGLERMGATTATTGFRRPAPPPRARGLHAPQFTARVARLAETRTDRWQARSFENYVGCVAWNYHDRPLGELQAPALKRDFGAHMRDDQAHEARVAAWQRLLLPKENFRLSDLNDSHQKTLAGRPNLPPLPLHGRNEEFEQKGNTFR
ncbi:unnamed protein product [Symbiodinium natans]|uniref:Uncharacterized protein n=1 Tax=Symbiodinium natans TaxID=878477 RepID=A0A812KWP9_9DINO|nr:unnamed protein product [Symbiodinium natans]